MFSGPDPNKVKRRARPATPLPRVRTYAAPGQPVSPELFHGEAAKSGSWSWPEWNRRPYNPAMLYRQKGSYALYDEIREDDQVHASLHMKKLLLIGSGWEIKGDDGEATAKLGVDYALRNHLDEGLDARLFDILTAMDYGFSMSEKIVAPVDEGQWSGNIFFKAVKTRSPHGWVFKTDPHGNITELTQDRTPMPYEKFIHYVHNGEFDNAYGRSDINRGVYRAWWSKDRIVSYANMYAESRAFPTLWGKYPKRYSKTDQANLLSILKEVQARTAFVTPEETLIEVLKGADGAATDLYVKLMEYFDLRIARGVLIPDLAGLSGAQTSGGSYALGKEQFGMLYQILGLERIQLERMVNNELVRPLVDWNWGNFQTSTVRFAFKPLDDKDVVEMAKTWAGAVGTLWEPSDEEINHFRQSVGFPEGVVTRPAPPAPAFGGGFGAPRPGGPGASPAPALDPNQPKAEGAASGRETPGEVDAERKRIEDEDAKREAEARKKAEEEPPRQFSHAHPHAPGSLKVYAERTVAERRVNFEQIESRLNGAEGDLTSAMAAAVRKAVGKMAATITERRIIENKNVKAATGGDLLPKSLVTDLRKALRESMRAQLDHGYGEARREVTGRAYSLVGGVGGLDWGEVRDVFDETASHSALDIWDKIQNTTTPILTDAVRNGWSVPETMRRLDGGLQRFDEDYSAPWLETVARVNLMKCFNEGRAQAFEESMDQISAFQLSAIMDGRTTDLCISLDGKIIPASEMRKWIAPFHYGCRTISTAILTGDEYQLSKMPNVQPDGGTFMRLAKEGPEAGGE